MQMWQAGHAQAYSEQLCKGARQVNWRHNEVLKILHRDTEEQIEKINSEKRPQKVAVKNRVPFVRPGQKSF